MSDIQREVVGVEGISCVLSVLILLYSKAIDNSETPLTLVLSCFLEMHLELLDFSRSYIFVPNITYILPHLLHWNESPHHEPSMECASTPGLGGSVILILALFPVGYIKRRTYRGSRYVTISSISSYTLPDLSYVNTFIDHLIQMQKYNSNCSSWMSWFDLAKTPCLVFEPEPLNDFQSIENIIAASFKDDPLEVYFWAQSTVPSPWNVYCTDTAREGRG